MMHMQFTRRLASLAMPILVLALVLGLALVPSAAHAQSGNQWRADFYPNTTWWGPPVYTQYANAALFNWGTRAPGPNMPSANWTARLTSNAFFYSGLYRFTIVADDEFVLYVDGATYLSTVGAGQSGKAFVIDLSMSQGNHFVQVDFRQFTGPAYISVDWEYLKNSVPPPVVQPPVTGPGTPQSVVTRYGDYTPCIQQGLHQSKCFQSDGQWDSPNLGSIEIEPQIIVWGNCTGDSIQTMQLFPDRAPQPAKCSKTEAGWFAN